MPTRQHFTRLARCTLRLMPHGEGLLAQTRLWLCTGLAVVAPFFCVAAFAQELVQFGSEPALTAYYYRAASAVPESPVIVTLHGCSGMLDGKGEPNQRARSYAALLNAQGWHVLALDSFSARQLKTVCGNSARTLTPEGRVPDVQAAIAWLAARAEVDKTRMGILGWSHGGSVTLLANASGVIYATEPRAALAFYPGCGRLTVPRDWQPARPILMQLGQSDDWTDPAPCQALARQFPSRVLQDTYPESGHGFDSEVPVRPMVLQAGTPRQRTVHVGGNPVANEQSKSRLLAYFQHHFQLSLIGKSSP